MSDTIASDHLREMQVEFVDACKRGSTEEARGLLKRGRVRLLENVEGYRQCAFDIICCVAQDLLPDAIEAAESKEQAEEMLHKFMLRALEEKIVRPAIMKARAMGASVGTTKGAKGHTALHVACQIGSSAAIVRDLLAAGADIMDKNDYGHNALASAFCNQAHAMSIVPIVYSKSAFEAAASITGVSWTTAHVHCAIGGTVPSEECIDVCTPIQKFTMLHIAAASGHIRTFHRIAHMRPHMLSATDALRRTPLDLARLYGHMIM